MAGDVQYPGSPAICTHPSPRRAAHETDGWFANRVAQERARAEDHRRAQTLVRRRHRARPGLGPAHRRRAAAVQDVASGVPVRWRATAGKRLPALAAELVELKVDVIVTVGGPASAAAKRATSSIPIVLALVGDADGIGLIESLARPGSNVTGVTDQSVELSAKRLEFLTEAVPKAARIAVLWNADDRGMTLRYREVEKAAQRLHVAVQPLGVREPDDFETAFSAMTQHRPDALFLVTDALTNLNRTRVIDFAQIHRIPA